MFEALGGDPPEFAHLPLLLGPDGSKLSKRRHGEIVSVTNYRDHGFLPQGIINYLCLLGWSPKDNQELLARNELIELFKLESVNRTNAVVTFDEDSEQSWADPKALWINGQQLRSLPVRDLLPHVEIELREAGWWRPQYESGRKASLESTVDLIRSRFNTLKDFTERGAAYFNDTFPTDIKAEKNLNKEGVRESLRALADRLATLNDFTSESVETTLRSLAEERGMKAGLMINGARAALSGQSVGPSAFAIFTILGRDCVIDRLRKV